MTIKGENIVFIAACIHYEFGECDSIKSTVSLQLLVDGKRQHINKKCEDTEDLEAKIEAFKAGVKITELTI